MTPSKDLAWADVGFAAAHRIYRWLFLALCLAYLLSGFAILSPGEVGLIRRFGRWVVLGDDRKVALFQPGLVFAFPYPIDQIVRLPVKQELVVELDGVWPDHGKMDKDFAVDSASPSRQAITGDQCLVEVKARIRFRIEQPELYATSLQDPLQTIQHVVQSALAKIVSQWSIDEVLGMQRHSSRWDRDTMRRLQSIYHLQFDHSLWESHSDNESPEAEFEKLLRRHLHQSNHDKSVSEILNLVRRSQTLSEAVLSLAQQRLELLAVGAKVTTLEIDAVQPPGVVRDAFFAVHDARVDQESLRQEAQGEQLQSVIEAEMVAKQVIADSTSQLVSREVQAMGEAEMFSAELAAIRGEFATQALTRMRRDAWEEILTHKARVYAVPRRLPVRTLHLTIPDQEKTR